MSAQILTTQLSPKGPQAQARAALSRALAQEPGAHVDEAMLIRRELVGAIA